MHTSLRPSACRRGAEPSPAMPSICQGAVWRFLASACGVLQPADFRTPAPVQTTGCRNHIPVPFWRFLRPRLWALPRPISGAHGFSSRHESHAKACCIRYIHPKREYCGKVQYLLPICLTDMRHCDLALALTPQNGYYLGHTCLTLEMSYHNARLLTRPQAVWLRKLVDPCVSNIGFDYETVYGMEHQK